MKYFDSPQSPVSSKYLGRKLSLAIALVAAICMWYFVCVQNVMETQIRIKLEYHGLPKDLVVTNGLVPDATVRLRGPATLLRAIPAKKPEKIDLSVVKPGKNRIPLGENNVERATRVRAFELIDIDPPGLDVEVDILSDKSVQFELVADDSSESELYLASQGKIKTIKLKGPEQVLKTMPNILRIPVRLDSDEVGKSVSRNETIDTPNLVTSVPPAITISYTVGRKPTHQSKRCRLRVESNNAGEYLLDPDYAMINVLIPVDMNRAQAYMDRIVCSVVPGNLAPGQSRMADIVVHGPEGFKATLQRDKVKISRKAAAKKPVRKK